MHWLWMVLAIVGEVIGTSALKASEGFTRLAPSIVTVAAYGVSFFFLALALRVIPVGVAYAIWSGVGIVLISLIGFAVFGQRLDAPAILGIALIMAGVIVIQTLSSSLPD